MVIEFSDDGFHVIGERSNQPFYWNQDGDFAFLPPPGGGFHNGEAVAITADGSIVLGNSRSRAGGLPDRGWCWTIFGGTVDIGSLVDGGRS